MITVNGLPIHPLLVHFVLVLLPGASLLAILGSVWPAAQRKFTFLTPLLALVGLILVPITVTAGENLADHMGIGAAINEHATLARRILPFAIGLFVTSAGQWAYLRFVRRRTWMTVLIALLVIAAAIATTVQVVLTGDAGAHAVWGGIGGAK
ncbi:DUF2231 domain-containing protein [Microlunatus soli]|uniref:DUF2231 domain-containing protein n=1 Tax=Microlunatus soli TaxID=630515 RepID=A0A1H1Y7H8_9ACTN|nr:DUF2231 domain-containing protein [Microlunatus soli]SDT17325.1 hypothetical protein SAMN04489812_4433 [Microlunatus soli]